MHKWQPVAWTAQVTYAGQIVTDMSCVCMLAPCLHCMSHSDILRACGRDSDVDPFGDYPPSTAFDPLSLASFASRHPPALPAAHRV